MKKANKATSQKSKEMEAEEMLRNVMFLQDHETLTSFLSNPYSKIDSYTNEYLDSWQEKINPFPNAPRVIRLFSFAMPLILLSSALYEIQNSTEDAEIKANSDKLRKKISECIIHELSPIIVSFFKWDFTRRTWKHPSDEYRISFLENAISEIDKELKGQKTEIVGKYVSLLLDFIIEVYDNALSNFDEFEEYNLDRNESFNILNKLKNVADNKKYKEILDEDAEDSFLSIYKPIAQNYIEGLLINKNEFDYLIFAFVEAQNDYKIFLQNILSHVCNAEKNYHHEIKRLLQTKDIDGVIGILRSIFSSIPYQLLLSANEAHYHSIFHIVFKLLGCDIYSEVLTNNGRIDAVIEFEDVVYIIEFKMNNSSEAIEQIVRKKYFEQYQLKNKEIVLLGLSFSKEQRNIDATFKMDILKNVNKVNERTILL